MMQHTIGISLKEHCRYATNHHNRGKHSLNALEQVFEQQASPDVIEAMLHTTIMDAVSDDIDDCLEKK